MKKQYPGLKIYTPGDGDFAARLMSILGADLDGRKMITFGRSGSAEATIITFAAAVVPNAQFSHRIVSTDGTSRIVTPENADKFSERELKRLKNNGYSTADYGNSRTARDIPGRATVAMTAVTGASKEQFGKTMSSFLKRINFDEESGEVTLNTLLVTLNGGSFIVRTKFTSNDVVASKVKLVTASRAAREFLQARGDTAEEFVMTAAASPVKLLASAEEKIEKFLKGQFKTGDITEKIYNDSVKNTFTNFKFWTENEDIYRLSPGIREANFKAIQEGRWRDIIDAYRQEIAFGTAGIRGKAALSKAELLKLKEDGPGAAILKGPNTINDIVLLTKTAGLIKYAKENGLRRIIIGFDSRIAGNQFADMIARLFIAQSTPEYQFQLFLFDEASPFPELTFGITTPEVKADLGILISASHNPADYNGYKITRGNGAQLNQATKEKVLEAVSRVDLSEIFLADSIRDAKKGQVTWLGGKEKLPEKDDYYGFDLMDMHTLHIEQVKKFILDPKVVLKHGANVNIGFAAYNGAGYKAIPRILKETGFTNYKVVPELQVLDGLFPAFQWGEQPDPGDPIAADIAVTKFIDEYGQKAFDNLDVLFGTDPDADRMGEIVKVPKNQQKYFGKYRLLSANDAWTLLLWYRLMTKKALGQLSNPQNHYVTLSHVTTDAIPAVADSFGIQVLGEMKDKSGKENRGRYLDGKRDWVGFTYIAETFEKMAKKGLVNEGGFEESNGVSIEGHVNDKDGTLAVLLMAEVAAYAKENHTTTFELLDDIYKELGHYATANKPLPRVGSFEGAAGVSEKINILKKAQEWAILANKKVSTTDPFVLAEQKVIGAIEFKSGRIDHTHYDGVPDEGVRFFFEDKTLAKEEHFTKSKNFITIRPSGTSQTLRFYTQYYRRVRGKGGIIAKQKFDNYQLAEKISLLSQKQFLEAVGLQKYIKSVDAQIDALSASSPMADDLVALSKNHLIDQMLVTIGTLLMKHKNSNNPYVARKMKDLKNLQARLVYDRHENIPLDDFEYELKSIENNLFKASYVQKSPGGINLNPELLDLQIKRDGRGIPLPVNLQPIHTMKIDGFVPIIINITPVVSMPMLLGFADGELPFESADADKNTNLFELGYADKYRQKYIRVDAEKDTNA